MANIVSGTFHFSLYHGPQTMATLNLKNLQKSKLTNHVAHIANEISPSSTAIQLISKVTTANKSSTQAESQELQRLTTEVSNFESKASEIDDPEIQLAHKHKLIYVLSRAVLERLTRNDPFVNLRELVDQAGESLDLFYLNICASPSVLVYTLKPGEYFQGRGSEPLWIWLFPRVLSLLGRPRCEGLCEKIRDLFQMSFQATVRLPKLWSLGYLIFGYLKECISSLLSILSVYQSFS